MFRSFTLALIPALLLSTSALAAPDQAVPVAELVRQVDIPHQQFRLRNGLRVIVNTDRKAPVVAVAVWYDVGSKHEPRGRSGFAHLFEHLMFGGSENVENFDQLVIGLGGANNNGSTWFDRTNYYQTVPRSALESMLFVESDRMGYLLGAVSQEKLDAQRGVVQNEKRQGDNQPYGLVEYAQLAALLSPDHPYGHSTIGSMADLDAASLDDVRAWFRAHYGPNNAVLVLSGDIDVKTARPLVERYFGGIPRGPQQTQPRVSVPTLAAPRSDVLRDNVANVRLYRTWMIPGIDNKDSVPLDVAAAVLGGLASSRLDNALVRDEKLAVAVTASSYGFAQLGQFEVTVDVRPGVDPETASKRLDAIIADFIRTGPSEDEVRRVVMRSISGQIAGLEATVGKTQRLAEGALYRRNSNFYKQQMRELAAVTPAQVSAALARWIARPAYVLRVEPGERAPYDEAQAAAPHAAAPAAAITRISRPPLPQPGPIADLDFPDVTHARLSNGIELVYALRTGVPVTQISLSFDAGHSADSRTAPGTQAMMLTLLDEGAAGLNSTQIAEEQERLGANITTGVGMDRTSVNLFALSGNLSPSLALFSNIVQRPDFVPAEVERLRGQQLARIAAELKQPQGMASRVLPQIMFGQGHPYGVAPSGLGTTAAVKAMRRDDLIRFHQTWFRPERAKMFVVSDRPLAEIKAALEARFGAWAPAGTAGTKPALTAIPAPKPRIILVDRPDSPQSLIYAGQVLNLPAGADFETLNAANEVLGAGFLSRFNSDLREKRGWSYGVRGRVNRYAGGVSYTITAPVQADKTGESVGALIADVRAFLGPEGVTADEYDRTVNGNIRELPGSFELASDVLGGMQNNDLYGRPDNWYESLASRTRAMTRAGMDASVRAAIRPDAFVWVVVGDAKTVRPQLEKLGLPVESVTLDAGN